MLSAAQMSVALAGRTVLSDITLTLSAGALTVVVGPNGAGKSTLLKALAGTLAPSGGQVLLDGRPLPQWTARDLARRRAVLSQGQRVDFPFTVFEVVALGRGLWEPRKGDRCRRLVLDCLAAVDLADYEGRLFQQLSGGEQQRVQIARVLCQMGGPGAGSDAAGVKWLFLDEPTSSLDIAHQLAVLDLAKRHVRAGGGALAVLHDLNLASLYADRLIVMSGGRIASDSAAADALGEPMLHAVFGDRISVHTDAATGRRYVLPKGLRE